MTSLLHPLVLGIALLTVGSLLRCAAVVEDARGLTATDDPSRSDRLRGTYVAVQIGAALVALGLTWTSYAALGTTGLVVALLLAPITLVATELLPRALAGLRPGRAWSSRLGRALWAPERALAGAGRSAWSHQGLAPLANAESAHGSEGEPQMARRVYDFADVLVGDIMVPLINVSAVRDDTPIEEIVRIATREGFSRFPVYQERLPSVVGLVHVFDLLETGDARTAADLMRPATFVPEMAPASEVLRQLQEQGVNLAVSVDEYGGAVGIVAIEDILEEVVGEIEDEYDVEEDPVRQVGAREYLVEGTAEVSRLNERFSWSLPEGEYETIGGMLVVRLARIPRVGETVELEETTVTVMRASPRCVEQVSVRRKEERA